MLALVLLLSMLVLFVVVVLRKLQRDVREQRSARHRAALHEALLDPRGPRGAVAAAACGGRQTQTDLLSTLWRLQGEGQAPSATTLAQVDRGRVQAALRRRMDHRDPSRRALAALLGARLGLVHLTPDLVALLDDEDADVRLAACGALGLLQSGDAAAGLIGALRTGTILPVRVIERLGWPWAVDALLAALPGAQDEAPHVVRALGLAGDRRAVDPLATLLADGDVEVRVSAARALGELGGPHAAAALVRGLRDPTWEVRAQTARALGAVPTPAAVPLLEGAVSDGNWWVRTNAAAALGQAGAAGRAALMRIAGGPDRFGAERAREALELSLRREEAMAHASGA